MRAKAARVRGFTSLTTSYGDIYQDKQETVVGIKREQLVEPKYVRIRNPVGKLAIMCISVVR